MFPMVSGFDWRWTLKNLNNKENIKSVPKIMILGESCDKSTDLVCLWLKHWNIPFLHLNEENGINPVIEIEYEDAGIKTFIHKDGIRYNLNGIQKT